MTAATEESPASVRDTRLQVGLILAGTSFVPFATSGFGLLLPLIRDDLRLSYTEAGSLAAAATLAYAAMQVPAGMLADRIGARRPFLAGTLATNALTILLALTGSYLAALVVQLVAGAVRALAFAPGLVFMSSWFPAGRRATAMGLFVAGGFAWTVLFSIVAPSFAAATDWRTVLIVFGGMGVGIAAISAVAGRPGRDASGGAGSAGGFRRLMRRRAIWLVGLIQFTRLAVVHGVALWLPTFLVVERGLPLAAAGGIVAGMAVATAPSNLAGGYVADRSGRPYLVIGGSLVVLAVALLGLGPGPTIVIGLAVALIACFQQAYFGPLFAAPITTFGQGSAGLVSGAGNLFANVGAAAAGLSLGAIIDATGSLVVGFRLLAALCLVAAAATWALQRLAATDPAGGVESAPTPDRSPSR